MEMTLDKLWEMVMDREAWHAAVRGGHKELDMTEWLQWAELKDDEDIKGYNFLQAGSVRQRPNM